MYEELGIKPEASLFDQKTLTPSAPKPGLEDRWRNWMSQPANRAALLQFGISMMQPIGVGQSPMGHLGQAIGEGAQAQGRQQEMEIAQESALAESGRKSRAEGRASRLLDIKEMDAKSKAANRGKGRGLNSLFRTGESGERSRRLKFWADRFDAAGAYDEQDQLKLWNDPQWKSSQLKLYNEMVSSGELDDGPSVAPAIAEELEEIILRADEEGNLIE